MNVEQSLARARIYDVLASLYLNQPDAELVAAFGAVAGALAQSAGLTDIALPIAEDVAALQADYNALFFVPVSGRYLPPYESAQRARRLWGPITHQVADFYASVGFDPARLRMDEHWQRLDAPDHIGVELACLSALWQTRAAAPAPEITGAIDFFTREHIRRWLPAYGDQLAQNAETSLYRLLGRLTRAFVENEDA